MYMDIVMVSGSDTTTEHLSIVILSLREKHSSSLVLNPSVSVVPTLQHVLDFTLNSIIFLRVTL